jgi:hypothetical protein
MISNIKKEAHKKKRRTAAEIEKSYTVGFVPSIYSSAHTQDAEELMAQTFH